MANGYGKMLDDAFGKYYEKFREKGALSKETAVTLEEIFPEGQEFLDSDRMHKMLSMGIVKRVGVDRYWLDEKVLANPNKILLQRFLLIIVAVVLALVIVAVGKHLGLL
jgi:hypothetical protein